MKIFNKLIFSPIFSSFKFVNVYAFYPTKNSTHQYSITLEKHRKMSTFSEKCVIGTHNGVFHCDEALACFMLRLIYPVANIVRTRDQKILDTCDIVVDVGGEYAPEKYRFDHHQRSFNHTMSTLGSEISSEVKLSSAGLIYHHYGKEVLKKMIATEDLALINYIYKRVYFNFIQEIDGIDNGVPAYPGEPLYTICTHICNRVQHLLKPWNIEDKEYDENEHFEKAMTLVGNEFSENVERAAFITYPAREIVKKAIENRFQVHSSGKIIELERHCPWKDHFFDLEAELKLPPEITYVLFDGDGQYRVMGVSLNQKSFLGRKFLPPSWRGLRDEVLSNRTGIDGCIFVHHNGFIGGHKNREGALQMAIKALSITENES